MEKATNYSLSFFYEPTKLFMGNVSVFYNQITDRITYVRGDGGIGRYENLGESSIKGCEFSFNIKPVASLIVKPSYTYLVAKDDITGNWLTCKPRHKIRIDFIYSPMENLSLILNTKYVSRQFSRSDNTESVAEYVTVIRRHL